jgi:hypothetical protein
VAVPIGFYYFLVLIGAGKTYLNVVTLSFVNLAFLVLYPFALSTHECGYWLVFVFAYYEIISLTENEYSGLEFCLDQPKICILVGIPD